MGRVARRCKQILIPICWFLVEINITLPSRIDREESRKGREVIFSQGHFDCSSEGMVVWTRVNWIDELMVLISLIKECSPLV